MNQKRKKFLVIQSYRTTGVSEWIEACLQSVKSWAEANEYDYEFVDDKLFDYAPSWFRERCASQVLPITDIARLYLLREKLDSGEFHQVVWIDADVAVFAPDLLNLEKVREYAFCSEVWISRTREGKIHAEKRVNNSMLVMSKGHPLLDFLIFAGEELIRCHPPGEIGFLTVGTKLLTRLALAMPLRVIPGVGMFSPPVIRDLANGEDGAIKMMASMTPAPVGAANLCGSLVGQGEKGGAVEVELVRALDILMASRGEVFNEVVRSTGVGGGDVDSTKNQNYPPNKG